MVLQYLTWLNWIMLYTIHGFMVLVLTKAMKVEYCVAWTKFLQHGPIEIEYLVAWKF